MRIARLCLLGATSLLLVALPVGLAACGGDDKPDGPTKAETAAAANQLCKAANEKSAKDSLEIKEDNAVVFLAANESRYKIVKPMYQKMVAIKPAEQDGQKWDAFIDSQRQAIASMDQFREFARTKPSGGQQQLQADFQGHVEDILAASDKVEKTGLDYGAVECEAGPYIHLIKKPTGLPDPDGPTKLFSSDKIGVTFEYPKTWRKKSVTGESSSTGVAFGDDENNCGIIVSKRPPPQGKASDSAAATRYARGQVAQGRKAADSYTLIRVGPESGFNVEGAAIVRRWTTDGSERAGHIAFFFDNGRRYVIDCVATDVANFKQIDADQFGPLIGSFRSLRQG